MGATSSMLYTTRLEARPNGGGRVPVPFDPNKQWGAKHQHPVAGTLNVRGMMNGNDGSPKSSTFSPTASNNGRHRDQRERSLTHTDVFEVLAPSRFGGT